LLIGCGVACLFGTAAAKQATPGRRGIVVVQVRGLIDPPLSSLIRDTITDANKQRKTLVLIQLDSKGAIIDVASMLHVIRVSRVPVVVWVGPSGAQAKGGAALVAEAAQQLFVSQGSSIGPAYPSRLDDPESASLSGVRDLLSVITFVNGHNGPAVTSHELSARAAQRVRAVNGVRPTVGETIVQLDGTTVRTTTTADRKVHTVKLSTATVVGRGRTRRRHPNQQVVFQGLTLGPQIQHGLISPPTAYFLLVAGLALAVFEFYAASVGFAAAVGALAILGSMYGFSHLPVHWWAVGVLMLGAFGFAVDAQAGGSRFWTVTGILSLVVGSLFLYGGSSELRPAWWTLATVVVGAILFYVFAVPSFLRARFSTPTVGREGMIDELGTAAVAVDPNGVVLLRGASWRARTNRATPIAEGETVGGGAVVGLVLEVEPGGGCVPMGRRC
jgi:membrane-bound serine protease (ClpP class)